MSFFGTLLFFLPAGVANMSPVLANRLPIIKNWQTPMDFGLSYHGKRLLGDNKRWRGVVLGTLMAVFTGLITNHFYFHNNNLKLWLIHSALVGLGALLGDAIESYFKRLVGKKPGERWFPFDQLDYIVGGLVLSGFVFDLDLQQIAIIVGVYFGLHLVVAYIAFLLGLKEKPI